MCLGTWREGSRGDGGLCSLVRADAKARRGCYRRIGCGWRDFERLALEFDALEFEYSVGLSHTLDARGNRVEGRVATAALVMLRWPVDEAARLQNGRRSLTVEMIPVP